MSTPFTKKERNQIADILDSFLFLLDFCILRPIDDYETFEKKKKKLKKEIEKMRKKDDAELFDMDYVNEHYSEIKTQLESYAENNHEKYY